MEKSAASIRTGEFNYRKYCGPRRYVAVRFAGKGLRGDETVTFEKTNTFVYRVHRHESEPEGPYQAVTLPDGNIPVGAIFENEDWIRFQNVEYKTIEECVDGSNAILRYALISATHRSANEFGHTILGTATGTL